MPSQLWQRIRATREYARLTQEEVSRACGVSRAAVSLWETVDPHRRTAPTVQNLTTLASLAANATGYPVHDVAGWLLDDSSDLAEPWAGRKAAPNRDDNGVAAVYGNQRTRDLVAAFSDLDQAQQAHVLALVEALSKAS